MLGNLPSLVLSKHSLAQAAVIMQYYYIIRLHPGGHICTALVSLTSLMLTDLAAPAHAKLIVPSSNVAADNDKTSMRSAKSGAELSRLFL